jgi:hypothetical protein
MFNLDVHCLYYNAVMFPHDVGRLALHISLTSVGPVSHRRYSVHVYGKPFILQTTIFSSANQKTCNIRLVGHVPVNGAIHYNIHIQNYDTIFVMVKKYNFQYGAM